MSKYGYIIVALDANALVLCNKHLEVHGCNSEDILRDIQNILRYARPAEQECLEKITNKLLDLVLTLEKGSSQVDYEIIDTINSTIDSRCSLENILNEFTTITGSFQALSKLSVLSHSILKLRHKEPKRRDIQYIVRRYLNTVKQCTKNREIKRRDTRYY